MKKALLLTALLAAVGAAQAQSATYAIDPSHTAVTFEAKHFGTSTLRGRWDKKEGTVTLDKAAKTGKVEFTLDMNSLTTGTAPFDGHLKSNDFFAAEQFPTAKFVGRQVHLQRRQARQRQRHADPARQDQPGHADGHQLQLL